MISPDDRFEVTELGRAELCGESEPAMAVENQLHTQPADEREREVSLGVIEFHSPSFNPGLIERFYAVVDDLRDAACIVDLWLMDIATVLREHGYEMRVYRTTEKHAVHIAQRAARLHAPTEKPSAGGSEG